MKRFILCLLTVCLLIVLPACTKPVTDPTEDPGANFNYVNNYTDYDEVEANKEGITWPEGQALPSFATPADELDAINIGSKNNATKATASAFAGIINRKQPRIYLYTPNDKTENWPDETGLNLSETKNLEDVVLKYKDEIKGLIVWDKNVPDTINLATTIAGFKDAMIVNEKQLETFSTGDFSFPVLEDLRGRFNDKFEVYNYLYDNLWKDCEKRILVGIKTDGWELRDLATSANTAVVWLASTKNKESQLLRKFLADCTPGEAHYMGWWDSEGDGVTLGSEYGIPTIPSDYYYNYTVHAGASRELDIPTVPAKPELENKYYISFTFSEGDNLQYDQHAMKNASQLWPNKGRGKYPINWTSTPALLDAGPQILNYYYRTATENDLLICGPSGLGYTNPIDWKEETSGNDALVKYAQITDSYFRRTAFNIATVWNFIREDQQSIYAQNIRSLIGFTVQERLSGQPGQNIVDGRIPLLTTDPRYDSDIPRVTKFLEESIEKWDGESPVFRMPQLISWNTDAGVPAINKMANSLIKKYGDKVAFVRGDHLMMLYSEANNIPYNVSLQAENVTASGSDDSYSVSQMVDGSYAKSKGWQCSDSGDKWAVIDLKEEYTLSRYVLKNAAAGYYSKELNTKGYRVQASTDGDNWTDIDVVTNNTSNIVDKDVDKFDARYIRLYIMDPGADGVARVQEFEVYGIRK